MAGFFLLRKPVVPGITRKRWSNITTGQSENLREQTDDIKEKQTEDNSRERGVESQLRAAAKRRTSEKWRAKEDKIEEANKQKTKRSDDQWNHADWQPSSWSWQQMTWTSFFIFILATVELGSNVSVLIGDHRFPGNRRSHGSEGPHPRGHLQVMTTKKNVWL